MYIPPIRGKYKPRPEQPQQPDLAGSVFGVAKLFNELETIKKDITKWLESE